MKKWLLGAVALVLAGPAAGQVVKTETATTYTFVNTDCDPNGRTTIMFNNAIGVAATLPRAGTNGQFLSGCQIRVQNIGAGPVVITPTTSTINSGTNYTVVSGASTTIVPDAPPTTTGNYFAATGAVPPNANGRQALAAMPAYFTMADYGAATRPAKRRPAQVTIANASANLQIETTYSITASRLQCTSGSTTVTLTPGVFPNSANANNTKRIRLPGCGAASADLNADVTSITTEGTTQTIVVGTAAGTTVDTGGVQVVVAPQGLMPNTTAASNKRLTYNVAKYGPITFAAGVATLTATASTFATYDYTMPGESGGYRADIAIPNATGANCTDTLVTKITAIDGTGAIATLAEAPTCALTATSRWVYWGQAVFGPTNVGDAIELLDGGASSSPLVTTISSVTDPSHIVMAATNGGTKTNANTRLTWGPDGTSAWVAMTAAARAGGYQFLYFPRDTAYFLATGTLITITQNGAAMIWCGEGNVYLPSSLKLARPVSRGCVAGAEAPLADPTIVPSVHLRTSSNSGSTLKVVLVGDSQLGASYNGFGRYSMPNYFCEAFRAQNPSKTVDCVNRAIGGTVWGELDPTGPSYGNGAGKPGGDTADYPGWYTPTSNQWISFILAECPDVMVMKLGYNDGFAYLWSSMMSVLNYTQGATWRSSCGKTPDILIATEGPPGMASGAQTASTERRDYVMTYLRGWTRSCEYRLANGGCPGLIDIGRARQLVNLGWSSEHLAAARADYVVPFSSANDGQSITAATYTWPVNIYDYMVTMSSFRATAANVADWWASVLYVDFALGNGASGDPVDGGLQTGASTAYTGGHVRLAYDSGTGNYTVRVRTFDVDTAATVTAATATVTCSAACTNMGFVGAKIEVPGAGSAGGLYTGTITAINSAGTTITVSPNVSTAIGSPTAVTLKFYHEPLATTDTGVAASCTVASTICDSLFNFSLKGTRYTITDLTCFNCGPIYSGDVAKFGGFFRPTITVGGTFSRYYLTTDSEEVTNAAHGTPDDGTFYRPSLSDTFAWGVNDTIGQWGGGAFNHPSTLGDQIVVPAVLGRQNLNATPAPVSSAVNTPVNGFSYTTPDQQTFTAFTPAGTLATGAVVLPRNVPQSSRIQYMTTQELTALTVTAPSGYTISGTACAPCTVAANGSIAYTLSGTVFYRVQ